MNEHALKHITCALEFEFEIQHTKRQVICITKITDGAHKFCKIIWFKKKKNKNQP